MVVLRDIPFASLCEHHLLPFTGIAHVGYIPRGRIVGLSKLARLVEGYARRPQVQERLTSEVADALMEVLQPDGCGVVIEAVHTCMTIRGIEKPGATMVTSAMRGGFRGRPETRAEFMSHRPRRAAVNDGQRHPHALPGETRESLPPTTWNGRELRWGAKTHVMAILNLTPDSFSGDGLGGNANAALTAALRAVDDGADILDLGAESTRPGHVPISADEELARLLPAFTAIRARTDVLISVDTSKAAVAAEAIAAGANLINDVRGFTADPEMAAVVARAGSAGGHHARRSTRTGRRSDDQHPA